MPLWMMALYYSIIAFLRGQVFGAEGLDECTKNEEQWMDGWRVWKGNNVRHAVLDVDGSGGRSTVSGIAGIDLGDRGGVSSPHDTDRAGAVADRNELTGPIT